MEIVVKVGLSLAIGFVATVLLWKVWHSQIDVGRSARNVVDKVIPSLPDAVAVRDADSIYQDGEKVGDVEGVSEEATFVTFASIANTQKLKYDRPFDFRRMRLLVVKIETQIGMKSDGRSVKQAVLEGVVCRRVQ